MKIGCWVLVIMLLTSCAGVGSNSDAGMVRDAMRQHDLQVAHHQSIAVTRADALHIVDDMGAVLAVQDSAADVVCGAEFVLSGDLSSFSLGTGVINSAEDFALLYTQVPGEIKMVNMINYCGRFGTFLGCAPVPGDSLLVVRSSRRVEGVLWAHAYGHNQGLSHRSVARALMNPVVTSRTRVVNQQECEQFVAGEG